MIAICDAFEAMTNPQPYRDAIGEPEALAELRREAGGQFDPELVELFATIVAEPANALVRRP